MNTFEDQLQQMIPLIREPFVCRTQPKTIRRELRIKSFAKIALGFVLGTFVTYHVMLSNETRTQVPQKTFTVKFDESQLQQVRCPADMICCIVQVPIETAKDDQTQWQYGRLREQLQ